MRGHSAFALLALVLSTVQVFLWTEQPAYTDAYYHYNAAVRFARGEGLVDDYLWVYIGAPDSLPAPSHLYWMPFSSLVAGAVMAALGVSYRAAQIGYVLCLWGMVLLTYALALRVRLPHYQAWVAAACVLFGGLLARYWGTIDTFAPYALVGSGALFALGLAMERPQAWRWLVAGALCGLGHLTRADGLLLLLVSVWVLLRARLPLRQKGVGLLLLGAGYLSVMGWWFMRNLVAIGSPLPVGGAQSAWFLYYDQLFNYPPVFTLQEALADGGGRLLEIRWHAFWENLGTLIAVEGFIVLAPFMLWRLWTWRSELFWRGVFWFALGIHAAFTLVFALVGVRGGLFHAVTALMPFWTVLGIAGMNTAVEVVARRRRHWRPRTARAVFTLAVVCLVAYLSVSSAAPRRVMARQPQLYRDLLAVLPAGARVMRNDPAELYYYTGLGGVVLPNATPDVLPVIARRYNITHVMLEFPNVPTLLWFDTPPPFLKPVPFPYQGVRLYAIQLDETR